MLIVINDICEVKDDLGVLKLLVILINVSCNIIYIFNIIIVSHFHSI